MRTMMRGLLAAAAVAVVAGAGGAAQAADQPRIVVVSHGQASDPFWSVAKNGVDAAAKARGRGGLDSAPQPPIFRRGNAGAGLRGGTPRGAGAEACRLTWPNTCRF